MSSGVPGPRRRGPHNGRVRLITQVFVAVIVLLGASRSSRADDTAAPTTSGLTFRVTQRTTGATAGGSAATSDGDCLMVSVRLTRGRLSAANSANDAVVTFSDLPPGRYDYTVHCSTTTGASGSLTSAVEVLEGTMTPVVLSIGIVEPVRTAGTESIVLSAGRVDQKGGELDSAVRELTLLTELGYVTSRGTHQGVAPLGFTDLGVWSVAGSLTPGRRLSIGAKLVGLAKTPATVDSSVLQSAAGDVSYAFHPHLAIGVGGRWRTGLGSVRDIADGGVAITWRDQHSEFVKTEFSVGSEVVAERGTGGDPTRTSVLATASAELQLCWNDCRRRFGASWVGFDAELPLHHSAPELELIGAKPNSSLGFHIGSFMRVNKTFDLFADVAWRDRGDAGQPRTELGTLLGGFDQVQLSLGAIFYFHLGSKDVTPTSDYVRAL